jgi:hypothetical protein
MLVSRQLTNRILDDAQSLRKKSRQLRHRCRNTRSVSLLWRQISEGLVTALVINQSPRVKDSMKEAKGDTPNET